MLLTESQFYEIRQIVADYHTAFIVNTISPSAVAPEVLQALKDKGLVNVTVSSIEDAYLYGQVLAMMDNPQFATMPYDQFKSHIQKNPIPLNAIEQQAVKLAQIQAGQYAVGLGNKVGATILNGGIEADAKQRQMMRDVIQTETAVNIATRQSLKKLKSELGWATRDWTRDWQRIATTEKHDAMQHGLADNYAKKYGGDARVAKRAMPSACAHCKRLYLGEDGHPLIFKLSDLEANGTNVGRKAADWKAVVGPMHPWCQCQLIRVPDGWGFDENGSLVPGAEGGIGYPTIDDVDLETPETDLGEMTKSDGGLIYVIPLEKSLKGGKLSSTLASAGSSSTAARGPVQGTAANYQAGVKPRAPAKPVDGLKELLAGLQTDPTAKKAVVRDQSVYDFQEPMRKVQPMIIPKDFHGEDEVGTGKTAKRRADTEKFIIQNRGVTKNTVDPEDSDATVLAKANTPIGGMTPGGYLKVAKGVYVDPDKKSGESASHGAFAASHGGKIVDHLSDPSKKVLKVLKGEIGALQTYAAAHSIKGGITSGNKYAMVELTATELQAPKETPKAPPKKVTKAKVAPKTESPQGGVQGFATFHGGKLTDHFTDSSLKVLKLPKADVETLHKFKALYGIEAKVGVGGYYAMLNLTADNLKNLAASTQKVQEKKKTPISAVIVEPTITVTGTFERLGKITTAHEAEMTPPSVAPWVMQRGEKVTVNLWGKSVDGVVAGTDIQGKAVIKVGTQYHRGLDWKTDVIRQESQEYKPAYAGLPDGSLVRPDARQQKLLNKAMKEKCVGSHEGMEYANWLRDKGQEVYLVGGIVRDLVAGTQPKSKLKDAEIQKSMKDIDIVSTAHPALGRAMHHAVAPDVVNGGITNDASIYGLVLSVGHGVGLDFSSMASNDKIFTDEGVWDHSLEEDATRRDFTCNSLSYDPFNKVIIDPTGEGIADAQHMVLRLAPEPKDAQKNNGLAFRFWKFRMRNYKPEEKTLAEVKKNVAKWWSTYHEQGNDYYFNSNLYRVIGKKGGNAKVNLKDFRDSMRADGAGDLYDKYIKPREEKILGYTAMKKGKEKAKW